MKSRKYRRYRPVFSTDEREWILQMAKPAGVPYNSLPVFSRYLDCRSSLRVIAKEFGICPERVRQIGIRGLNRIERASHQLQHPLRLYFSGNWMFP